MYDSIHSPAIEQNICISDNNVIVTIRLGFKDGFLTFFRNFGLSKKGAQKQYVCILKSTYIIYISMYVNTLQR